MGIWDEDLSKEDLTLLVARIAETRHVIMIIAPNQEKEIPVGVMIIREDEKVLEPHVYWFPWATNRNKLEGIIRSAIELRKIKPVFIWADEKVKDFYTMVSKYGVMRRVGTFYNDKQYSIFQTKEM